MVRWWRRALGLAGAISVTAVGMGYSLTEETRLIALDGQTGRVQWSVPLLKRGHHAPQVVGDRIVVSQSNYPSSPFNDIEPMAPQAVGQDCIQQSWGLIAYDTASGRQRWIFCPDAQQFPALEVKLTHGMQFHLAGNRLYVPLIMDSMIPGQTVPDLVLTLDAGAGKPTWRTEQRLLQSLPIDTQPALVNGQLQVQGRKVSGELYGSSVVEAAQQVVVLAGPLNQPVTLQAFNATTGTLSWKQTVPDRLEAELSSSLGPVTRNYLLANPQQVFLVSPRDGMIGLDARTGTRQFQTKGAFWGRTLVTEAAFFQFEPAAVTAYDAKTGKRQWQQAITAPKDHSAYSLLGAVDQQTVYTCVYHVSQDQTVATVQVAALERQTGRQKWSKHLPIPVFMDLAIPPTVTAGGVTLIVANPATADAADLQVITLDAQTGATRWTFPLRIAGEATGVVRVYGLLASDADQVFVRDRAPRFHHWLARFR